MKTVEITTMSSKGQVVIPADIRDGMGLASGTKLMIMTDGDNLLLKPVQTPKMEAFRALVERSRRWAKETGLRKNDVPKLIRKVRHESRP
jgi:antitoxin PrlF